MAVFRAAHLPLVDPVLHGEVTLKYGLLLEGRTDLSLGVRKREGKKGRERAGRGSHPGIMYTQ